MILCLDIYDKCIESWKPMKKIIVALSLYLIVCLLTFILPGSDGYNTIGWKLLIGQIYAIPILIISIAISLSLKKKLY